MTIKSFLKNKSRLFFTILCLYILILTLLAFYRHYTFHSWWDLGLKIDFLNNSMFGKLFFSEEFGMNYFGAHFSPIFLLILPFYYIFSNAYTLIVIYSLSISLSVLPLFFLAKNILKNENQALMISYMFLIFPSVWMNIINDFVQFTLAMPIIISIIYFYHKKYWKWFYSFLFLLLFIQENTSLIVIFIGLVFLLKKDFRKGLTILIIGIGYFILTINILIPLLNQGFGGTTEYAFFSERFGYLGNDLVSIVSNIITEPYHALTYTPLIWKILYSIQILLPLLLLPIFSIWSLIAIPVLIQNIFSSDIYSMCINVKYSAFVIGVFFVSFIYTLSKLKKSFRGKILKLAFLLIIISTFINGLYPLSTGINLQNERCYKDDFKFFENNPQFSQKYHFLIKDYLKLIPKNSSIIASQHIYPHLGGYKSIKTSRFINDCFDTDYVIIDLTDGNNDFTNGKDALYTVNLLLEKYETLLEVNQEFFIFKKIKEGKICV